MSSHAFYCVPMPPGEHEDTCEAPQATAGEWTVILTHARGDAPTYQLVRDELCDPCAGHFDTRTALLLAAALLHQVARALAGRIIRKWTSKNPGQTPALSGHSQPARLGGGWNP
jgi:hypothetical protein